MLADETFAAGTAALDKGQYELGQEIIQDALNFYEQVFGAVHPESAAHFHTLGISATLSFASSTLALG